MSAASRLVITGCAIATMDAHGTELASGHIVIDNGRITAVGDGGPSHVSGERLDARGCLATPGLVNAHHHLYQWLTRGLAQEANLFEWLTELYPVWAHVDADLEHAAATAGLVALALSGCSTSTDHHYLFPRASGGLLEASIEAAAEVGLRFHPARGSMDLGRSRGGLPPDEVCEDTDEALAATERAIDSFHDPSFGSMVQIAVAPCSPFSASAELMRASAALARAKGVRLHTHLAETREENSYCLERFGVRPVDYVADLGWLGDDVWLAHCVHLDTAEVERFGATRTGVAHCPTSNGRLGAGIAPVASLLRCGAPVGLGVDGAASNEGGELEAEAHAALVLARVRDGADALSARDALSLATRGGARCLGRAQELGTLEAGKVADVALWRLDTLAHAGISDPVAALVMGPRRRVHHLVVDGRVVVREGRLTTVDEAVAATELDKAARRLLERAAA